MKTSSVRVREGILFFLAFVATIFLANWFIRNVGTECVAGGTVCLIPMWPSFGIGDGMVPSGVLMGRCVSGAMRW